MFDVFEKDKLDIDGILERLKDQGAKDIESKTDEDRKIFQDSFHQQAIQMGLLVQPHSDFASAYNVLREYLMSKRFEGCSSQTLKMYYNTLFNFICQLDEGRTLFDITAKNFPSITEVKIDIHHLDRSVSIIHSEEGILNNEWDLQWIQDIMREFIVGTISSILARIIRGD